MVFEETACPTCTSLAASGAESGAPTRAEVPRGLQSEALAYVDLLVLVAARRFAGFSVSSLSLAVVEYRCLEGRPDSTAGFANLTEGWAIFQYGLGTLLSDHATTCPETT